MFREPLEKHLDIDVVSVQVMQMNHIRLNFIKSFKKTFRSSLTMKTSLTIYASLKHIKFNLHVRGELHFVRFFRFTASTPERIRFFACGKKLLMLFHHNAAGRAVRHGINVGVDRH